MNKESGFASTCIKNRVGIGYIYTIHMHLEDQWDLALCSLIST